MPWIQVKIPTTINHAESIGDVLSHLGALSITFMDLGDKPIYEPQLGELLLWPETLVIGLFDTNTAVEAAVAHTSLLALVENPRLMTQSPLEDKDWSVVWKEHFHPICFRDTLWVCPSWCPVPDPDAPHVLLDPGLAFGTGSHETTALCLDWLAGLNLQQSTVLDFGCGSGILAIAALKLGCHQAIGIDIDPQAIESSTANALNNQVDTQLQLYLPHQAPKQINADVVVANILARPLCELRDQLLAHGHQATQIALSGILTEQVDLIISYYQPFLDTIVVKNQGDWSIVSGKIK